MRPLRHGLWALLALSTPACAVLGVSGKEGGDAHWPTWRGPHGTGAVPTAAPVSWSDDENVAWRVPIDGRGVSTPVVLGQRVFLTTAVPTGRGSSPGSGGGDGGDAEFHGGGGAQEEHDFVVLCLDRRDGRQLWRTVVRTAVPHEGFHKSYGSFASASPVADEDGLWVSFGSFGLYALDHDGEVLWTHDPGVRMQMRAQFGEGSSPAVHGDTLVQAYDHEGASFAMAFDKRDGTELWRTEREEPSVWSAPLFVEHGGRTQVVLSGVQRVRGYDLATGETIWECAGLGLNPIPKPVRHDDLVIAMSGYRDANILAVRLGGEGDLTGSDHVVWQNPKGPSYTASPVLVDGRLYCVMDRGFISCFDAATGEPHYLETRLPRGSRLKASPVAAAGRLYVATEEGDVHVIALGDEYELVGTNHLEDQVFIASPALADGDLLLRSLTELICVRDVPAPAE